MVHNKKKRDKRLDGGMSRSGDTFSTPRSAYNLDREDYGVDLSKLNRVSVDGEAEFTDFEKIIRDYALIQLGHPVVRVELTNTQLKVCTDEAISTLQYHAPQWMTQIMTLTTSANVNKYELPSWVAQNIEYVSYKKDLLTAPTLAGAKSLTEDIFIRYFQDSNIFRAMDMSQFYLIQQNLEMLRKILSSEGAWDIVDGKYLILYPAPKQNEEAIIIYRALNPETIHPFYLNWLQKYTLACSKIVLGTIRGKYRTLPSPAGGAQLDGDSLRSSGMEDKKFLIQMLIDEIEDPLYFTMY